MIRYLISFITLCFYYIENVCYELSTAGVLSIHANACEWIHAVLSMTTDE